MEPTAWKDELKSVIATPGALSVMTYGLPRMPTWSVDNLDSEIEVYYNTETRASYFCKP